jgi:hypothetical protein
MVFINLGTSQLYRNRKSFFIPHRDADVLSDCGSPLEWNRTGMTEHAGGTPATASGLQLHPDSSQDEQRGDDTAGKSL